MFSISGIGLDLPLNLLRFEIQKEPNCVTNLRLLEGITVFDLQGPPKAIEQELIFTSLDVEDGWFSSKDGSLGK